MKKIILLFISVLAFTVNVNADTNTNIEFNEEIFSKYFESNGYDVRSFDDAPVLEVNNLDNVTLYIALNEENGYEVDLYKFKTEEEAHKYFLWVINQNEKAFSLEKKFNLNKKEEINYSYIKAMLSKLHYFYMVSIDNYVIKTNIPKKESEVMNEIFDDLGFIENENKNDNNILILGISLVVIALIIVSVVIIRKIIKKRLNKVLK